MEHKFKKYAKSISHSNADLMEPEQEKPPAEEEKQVGVAGKKKIKGGSFESFNLSQDVFRAIKRKGYNMPTPI